METSWPLLASAVPALLAVLLLLQNAKDRRRRLPPGPPAVLLLGNLLWLRLRSSAADLELEPLLLRLFKRYGPVITLRIGSPPPFVASSSWPTGTSRTPRSLVPAASPSPNRPPGAPNTLLGVSDTIITRHPHRLRDRVAPPAAQPRRRRAAPVARPAVRAAPSWVHRVLMEKLRGSGPGDAPSDVTEALQYTMFCLLMLMCFCERLEEPAVRAVEDVHLRREINLLPAPTAEKVNLASKFLTFP
ncbi:putative cytochrome P450 superfamily protein [Panicum miliaceum]|uniref:Cytochrome P450 superfamily protein n=1 Tax=Panicum miliaceum TaxID=4540 RepID=A0A3L6T947_PANMI|nr:putative cytochrome P450 superfamily protein [Panicum miliaceum]